MAPSFKKCIVALLVLLATSLSIKTPPALADDQPQKRTITISGKGSVKAAPDMVNVSAGVESQAPTAKDALAKNTAVAVAFGVAVNNQVGGPFWVALLSAIAFVLFVVLPLHLALVLHRARRRSGRDGPAAG